MIARIREAIGAVCEHVVLLGDSVHLRELPRIADVRPGFGPLGGIEALMSSGVDEQYLIVPCDTPLVTPEILEALLTETGKAATMFENHPLPVRIAADALPMVKRLLDAGERAVWRLMKDLDAERVALPDEWAVLLENVNSPEDVVRVTRRSMRSRGASG